MKRILVTQRLVENATYPEVREALDVRWGAFMNEAGLLPIPLLNQFDRGSVFDSLQPDGLLLTGGNDLASLNSDPLSLARDEFETVLLKRCLAEHIPVLGVCRGMQFLVQYFGGKLEPVEDHVATRHELSFEDGSHQTVNSYHGFAARTLPECLTAEARTGDIVEACTHREHRVAGIMWHPERESPFAVPDLERFRSFFA